MFDDVFDDKQWKKARDATGLKGALTEKVSMGDEFKRFQQHKNAAAAKVLLQKITLYEKQLKEKHSKEKYYAKLLNVVHGQKAAIEAGIQAEENPTTGGLSDKELDEFVDEVVAREKEQLRDWDDPTNDPNAPPMGEARLAYLKLTKQFPTVEGQIKAERTVVADLLQKCKALETNPNLQAKPDSAIAVAHKIVDTLDKIQNKAMNLVSDFGVEGKVVRSKEGGEARSTKALELLESRLAQQLNQIVDTCRDCSLALKNALQRLGTNPQAQEILRRLHV